MKTKVPQEVYTYRPTWMHSDHYHCKRCGSIIECCRALGYDAFNGVRRVGICGCGQILIESDHRGTRWLFQRA